MRDVWIRGAAMTPFGKHNDRSARDLVEEAVAGALSDAEVAASDVQFVYVANALAGAVGGQECMRAQTVLRRTGLMGVPMVAVENADCSGSTALHLAWQAVASEAYDCVLVAGYEKFDHTDRAKSYRALSSTVDLSELADLFGPESGDDPRVILQLHGAHSRGDGSDIFEPVPLAQVSVKNHYHASLNPCAHYRAPVTVDQVLASRQLAGPLTRLMCAPPSDGAACLLVCAPEFATGRRGGARIASSVLRSGRGDDLRAAWSLQPSLEQAYHVAGLGPEDLDVAEVHDLTSIMELFACALLGFYRLDEAERVMSERTTWLGGRLPVNPSGGLIARGHPLGATGIAQVVELTWQLEGRCGPRQVESARTALAHNIGGWIGTDIGAGAIHILVR
jgi:acetyl-CoA acetyltransferase